MSGMVTTPPPRPSRSAFSTLTTVMARGYSGRPSARPAWHAHTFQVDLKPGDPEPFPDVRGFAKVSPESAGS
jgi:hypothetical protein